MNYQDFVDLVRETIVAYASQRYSETLSIVDVNVIWNGQMLDMRRAVALAGNRIYMVTYENNTFTVQPYVKDIKEVE